MKHVFFSDLDRTLIFARYKDKGYKCVDYRDGKEIAFMTDKTISLMEDLLKMDNLIFIPTTLRPVQHTLEMDFINKYNPKYMICTGGAEVYVDGELDLEWEKRMRNLIRKEDVKEFLNKINDLKTDAYEIFNMNDFFLKIKFKAIEEADKWVEPIKELMFGDYYVLHQSRMIFVMNKNIKKEDAVKYLIEKFSFENIHTAGDSEPDEMFTKIKGVKSYLPNHSTFKHEDSFITIKSGIEASEEILEELIKNIS